MMASVPPNIVGPSSNKDMLVARCISREFNCISRRTYVRMRTSPAFINSLPSTSPTSINCLRNAYQLRIYVPLLV